MTIRVEWNESMMNEWMQQLLQLSFQVGFLPFEEARERLLKNVAVFDTAIESCLSQGLHPSEIISIFDMMKSLLYRTQLARRHMSIAGHGDDASVLFIPGREWWDKLLERHRNITACYLYLSRSGALWAFTVSAGDSSPVQYGACEILTKSTGFHGRLIQYIHSTATQNHDFDLLEQLIAETAATIIPYLKSQPGHNHLFICPHGLLNIIPWHALSTGKAADVVFIDDIFNSISYIASIQDILARSFKRPKDDTDRVKMLAVLDGTAQLVGVERERMFFETLKHFNVPIDIVTDKALKASDIANYQLVSWSGHAKSDPCSWGGSSLSLALKRYSALEISKDWSLALGAVVVLAACETSIELASVDRLDEYCGLDHGFRIAGAGSVCGTLWAIRDAVAEKANVLLWTAMFGLAAGPSRAVTLTQRMLRTRKWPELNPNEVKTGILWQAFENGLRNDFAGFIPAYFGDIQCWAAFRCFGL